MSAVPPQNTDRCLGSRTPRILAPLRIEGFYMQSREGFDLSASLRGARGALRICNRTALLVSIMLRNRGAPGPNRILIPTHHREQKVVVTGGT
jgi:hypothetical protein